MANNTGFMANNTGTYTSLMFYIKITYVFIIFCINDFMFTSALLRKQKRVLNNLNNPRPLPFSCHTYPSANDPFRGSQNGNTISTMLLLNISHVNNLKCEIVGWGSIQSVHNNFFVRVSFFIPCRRLCSLFDAFIYLYLAPL